MRKGVFLIILALIISVITLITVINKFVMVTPKQDNKAEYNRVELYTDTINNCEFVIAISYISGKSYGSSGVSIIHAPFCKNNIHKYNVERDTLN